MPRRRSPRSAAPLVVTELPVIPVRDTVLFPHIMSPLFVDRDRSLRAIEEAMATDRTVLIVAQKNSDLQLPQGEDLYQIGTEAVIARVLRMPEGTTSVLVQGQRRMRILSVVAEEPFMIAQATPVEEAPIATESGGYTIEAMQRAAMALFEKCIKLSPSLPEDAYVAAMNADTPGWLADLVGSTLNIELARKMHVRGYFAVLALISDRAEDLADQVALVAAERAL